jgi:hypothetical protein
MVCTDPGAARRILEGPKGGTINVHRTFVADARDLGRRLCPLPRRLGVFFCGGHRRGTLEAEARVVLVAEVRALLREIDRARIEGEHGGRGETLAQGKRRQP